MARSDFCMPADTYVYYFEVTVEELRLQDGGDGNPEVGVGFCEEHVSLSRMVGWDDRAWGYHSDDGWVYEKAIDGSSYSDTYAEGATIGCGVNFHNHTAFFTRDGNLLGRYLLVFPRLSSLRSHNHITMFAHRLKQGKPSPISGASCIRPSRLAATWPRVLVSL
jgi:hypothetical protein